MTAVADAARWLRLALSDTDGEPVGWVASEELRRHGAAAGHSPRNLERARVRAGVEYRRVGGPGDQRSEWRLTESATFQYRHDARRRIEPTPSSRREVAARCSVCSRLASLPEHVAEARPDCLVPTCDGVYET